MIPFFTGTLDGVEEFNRGFNRVEDFISDFRFVWPSVISLFYTDLFPDLFASEGATSVGGKWPELTHSYATFKAIAFPSQTILKASNSLFDSLTSPEASGAIIRPERDELTLGTSIPYALAHHRGSPNRNLPKRSLNPLTETGKRKMQKAIQAPLVQFIRRQGFTVLENAA